MLVFPLLSKNNLSLASFRIVQKGTVSKIILSSRLNVLLNLVIPLSLFVSTERETRGSEETCILCYSIALALLTCLFHLWVDPQDLDDDLKPCFMLNSGLNIATQLEGHLGTNSTGGRGTKSRQSAVESSESD